MVRKDGYFNLYIYFSLLGFTSSDLNKATFISSQHRCRVIVSYRSLIMNVLMFDQYLVRCSY